MLIGVVSDTHDRLPAIEAALTLFNRRGVEAVIHPGDVIAPFAARRLAKLTVPLYITYGNNDGERKGLADVFPQIQDGPLWIMLDKRRILVHHFIDWCRQEDVERADIVITGHTHEVVEQHHENRLLLNSGECCGWVSGRCTVALLDTDDCSVEICELQL